MVILANSATTNCRQTGATFRVISPKGFGKPIGMLENVRLCDRLFQRGQSSAPKALAATDALVAVECHDRPAKPPSGLLKWLSGSQRSGPCR